MGYRLVRGQAQYGIIIVRCVGVVDGGFVADSLPAFLTAKKEDNPFFGRQFVPFRHQEPAAGVQPVSGVVIHMFGMKAIGAMVTACCPSRWDMSTTLLAGERLVDFGELAGLHGITSPHRDKI